MKVKPHKKRKILRSNEARIITIDENAIEELLLENLIQNQNKYFQLSNSLEDNICVMNWDKKYNHLTYVILPLEYCLHGYEIDCDYIRKAYGITTESLFKTKCFKSVILTDKVIKKKQSTGDYSTGDSLRES